MSLPVGLYARRSPRPTESETVARQIADSRALADELGWVVVEEYVDTDLSAYSRKKKRPAFDQMMLDLESGKIRGVVAAHTTRIYRHVIDFVPFLDLVQKVGAEVRTVTSGHFDLNTAAGRKHARQAGVDAMYESELLGERVARERKSRAAAGMPGAGGLRPFGYEPDKVTIRECEARFIRESAERVAAGGSLWSECEWWNAEGVLTTAGNPWEVTAMRRVLTNPRTAGLRAFKGQITGPAQWPAIIDQSTFERISAMTQGRVGKRRANSFWLLSGMISCPKCGRPLYGSRRGTYRAYACAPSPGTGRGCGGASVSAEACDQRVLDTIAGWLENPPKEWAGQVADAPRSSSEAEVVRINETMKSLRRRWVEGRIDEAELDEHQAVLEARLAELEQPTASLAMSTAALVESWTDATPELRRALLPSLIVTPMALSPDRKADPADRLTIDPR